MWPLNPASGSADLIWATLRYFAVPAACEQLDENLDFAVGSPMPKSPGKSKKAKALLLGVGLDSDGHKRVTTGPNFALLGGTKETHEVMTEKAIKINEKLAARGKKLEEVSREEFDDIAATVGLHRPPSN
jgi:hypothetical protein